MGGARDQTSRSDEHNARGIELADRGWLDEAINEFKKAIDLDQESAHAHDNLGTVFAEKGLLLEALHEFLAALRSDPENPTVHHYLASFLAAHASDLAIAEYRRAIDLEFDFPDAHLNLAMSLAERGLLQEAATELETAHQQDPEDEVIQHELACCLIDMERYAEAIGHLKKIVKTNVNHVEAYVDLGIAYTAQGFFAEAESTLKKALAIDPHDFASHYHLAALYSSWGKKSESLDYLERAAKQDSEKTKQWLRDDKIFEALHDEARFTQIIA